MKRWIAAAAALACAHALAQADKGLQAFEGKNGFVAVRIVTNVGIPHPLMGYNTAWRTLALKAADGGTDVQLSPMPEGGRRSTQVFAQQLAPGRYKPGSLRTGGVTIPLAANDLDFEVQSGRITNLGTLILQPMGNSEYTVLPFPGADDLREVLARDVPALVAAGGEPLGWTGGKGADGTALGPRWTVVSNTVAGGIVGTITMNLIQAKIESDGKTAPVAAWKETTDPAVRLRMAKQSTYSLNALQTLPTGEIVAGTNLGQVMLRDPQSGWQRFDLQDPREITALHAPSRERMVAGGEEGLLVSTQDGGKTWTRHKPPVAGELIVHIAEHEGQLLVLGVVGDDFSLHATRDLASGEWRELRKDKQDFSGLRLHPHMQAMGTVQGGRYYMVVPGRPIQVLDLATGAWTAAKLDGPFRFMGAVKDGFAYATGAIPRVAPYLSRDGGASWTKLENPCSATFSGVLSVSFLSPSEAYLLCFETGMWSSTYKLKRTKDAGASWADVGKELEGRPLQMYATPELVLYAEPTGGIRASRDGGLTWTYDSRAP
jgi:photosystem II stability/assembly factor-like uncharacterized protein